MTNSAPRKPFIPNNENVTRSHGSALEYCIQELNHEHPDYQIAQVYATLSVEEAIRDLAAAVGRAADRLASFMR